MARLAPLTTSAIRNSELMTSCQQPSVWPGDGVSAARAAGFTLLELMATVGVVAVLAGIGLGFMGRSSGVPEARVAIGAELRLAALSARTRGLPTEVVLSAGQGLENAVVKTRALEPVAIYAFEPGQMPADRELHANYGGVRVDGGRCGAARRTGNDEQGSALAMTLPPSW